LPIRLELGRVAADIGERFGTDVQLRLEDDRAFPIQHRENGLGVVREALTNAARHGKASHISVTFAQSETLSLEVRDDGLGFDSAPRNTSPGFGLVSMRERAEALTATLRVSSDPGHGATVVVRWS
jgi:signal transduction histidine kinase